MTVKSYALTKFGLQSAGQTLEKTAIRFDGTITRFLSDGKYSQESEFLIVRIFATALPNIKTE
jgi:hypothetical protein